MDALSQIKAFTFDKTNVGGYNTQQVDLFVDNLIDTVSMLREKNIELKNKVLSLEMGTTKNLNF